MLLEQLDAHKQNKQAKNPEAKQSNKTSKT
jgi:hypothetical protein